MPLQTGSRTKTPTRLLYVSARKVANSGTSSAIDDDKFGQTDIQHIDLFLSPHVMFHPSAEA